MELSAEDALRLNVLLANDPLAIRINESTMTLYGLLDTGEVCVDLNPNVADEKYLKTVRAVLSERALGSPAGYPLYLQRWTRMGRMREESLNALLKLGDPTAVFAVVCAEGLTDELARCAWWAAEEPENARRMLQTEAVVRGSTGRLLAQYLVEYLPFETETEKMIESVSMVLQPGLLAQQDRIGLWKKASRKPPYLVGFIASIPDDLPGRLAARTDYERVHLQLAELAGNNNQAALLMDRSLSAPGQTFLATCSRILRKPSTQDVVTRTLDVLRGYYAPLREEAPDLPLDMLEHQAAAFCAESDSARRLLASLPELREELEALHLLSGVGYGIMRSALSGSNAMGSLMRRKLEPVILPLQQHIGRLLGEESPLDTVRGPD